MKKYLAVEWLSFVPADQLSQLSLVSRAGGRLLDLVCRDDEGTLDTSVPIEELGQPRGHTCGVRNITSLPYSAVPTWGQDHVHVQGESVVGQTVVPGHVPHMVLRVVVASPPPGVLLAVDGPHHPLQAGPVLGAGEGAALDAGGPGRQVDGVEEAPGHVISDVGEAGPEVGDVELRHVELLVRDEDHHGERALPGSGALHQPVEPLHRALGGHSHPGKLGELLEPPANHDLLRARTVNNH